MLNYTLLLHGLQGTGEGLPGALLRDLLDAVDRAKGAVLVTADRDFDVLHPEHLQRERVDPKSLR